MEYFSKYIQKDDNEILKIAALIADKGSEGAEWCEITNFLFVQNQINENEKLELLKYDNFDSIINLRKDESVGKSASEKFLKIYGILDNGSSFNRNEFKIFITFEGISSLLDFIELKHARKNSKDAKIYSLLAIGISILALISSLVIGLIQLNTPLKIDDVQIKKIEEINNYQKLNEINQNLIKIISDSTFKRK